MMSKTTLPRAFRSGGARRLGMPSAAGRTLIELLVAIGLGLLILLGVGTLFLSSSQSTRVASNIAAAEETGQVILSTVGAAIQRAGYSEILGTTEANTRADLLFSGAHIRGCNGGGFTNAAVGDFSCGAPAANASDVLMVAFQADNVVGSPQAATLDCLGQNPPLQPANPAFLAAAPAGVPVVQNIYFLNGAGDLQCVGSGGGVPQTLVSGVESFKVYFWFDDALYANPVGGNTNRPTANSVRTGSFINALADPGPAKSRWDFVVSVILCVQLRTQEGGVTTTAAPQFQPCPATDRQAAGLDPLPPVSAPVADGAVRRSYTQVFAVRSRIAPQPTRGLGD